MRFLFVCLLFLACGARAESIFPENDLGQFDRLDAVGRIDEPLFNQIISAGLDSYAKNETVQRNERLQINRLWSNSTVNANVNRSKKYGGTVTVNMYGGLARRPELVPASFAIVLCHELGHAYGGEPLIDEERDLAAEGQADWYATRRCLKRIWERVPTLQHNESPYEPFIEDNCIPNDSFCRNGLAGAKGLAVLLSSMMRDTEPAFETPDPFETPTTILSYPKTAQCRLDSYAAGIFSQLRPRCWFKP